MSTVPNRKEIAGYQSWKHLLFLHWRANAQNLQSLLPDQLSIETFDGVAWLGLVPFSMERVRPWWSPAVPGISWFRETNLRTYVRHTNGESGVWFFSLDADSRLAVRIARHVWNLNYVDAQLELDVNSAGILYQGRRRNDGQVAYRIHLPSDKTVLRTADPGSLEEFLLERYTLFAAARSGQLFTGRVHHDPYQFRLVTNADCEQTMLPTVLADSFSPTPDHVAYSPGVDVCVSRLAPVHSPKQPESQGFGSAPVLCIPPGPRMNSAVG